MDITVSIVSHNSLDTLPACLNALRQNLQGREAEIYVVDNLCENRSTPMLQRDFPEVIVIENKERLGFGANHNQVIRRSHARYFLALNPDVFLPDDAIQIMLDFMENNANSAVCGPRLVNTAGIPEKQTTMLLKPFRETILMTCYISNIDPEKLVKLGRGVSHRGENQSLPSPSAISKLASAPSTATAVPCISGACMFFRKGALDEIGGFDERFFLYFEETDWCLRARNKGRSIYYLPGVTAVHVGGTSTRANYLDNLTVYVKSAIKFYEKHRGSRVSFPLVLCVKAVATFNVLRWSIVARLRPTYRQALRPWISFSKRLAFKGMG